MLTIISVLGVELVARVVGVDVLRRGRSARRGGVAGLRVGGIWRCGTGEEACSVEGSLTAGSALTTVSAAGFGAGMLVTLLFERGKRKGDRENVRDHPENEEEDEEYYSSQDPASPPVP